MRTVNRHLLCRPRTSAGLRISNPRLAQVGDSLTANGIGSRTLNGKTMTRGADGVVTVTDTNHGIFGTPYINVVNCSDQSYEAYALKTTIDANSYSYPTSVTGAAGSIAGTALSQSNIQNRYNSVGYWPWLQAAFGGGLRNVGNFGQGGDFASDMAPAVAQANATDADMVLIWPGINDIKADVAAATVLSRCVARVNEVLAGGKPCLIIGLSPLGSGFATTGRNTATLYVNDGLRALANGSTVFFADIHPLLVDTGATQFTTGIAWSWVTTDGVHIGERAARIIAGVIRDVTSSIFSVMNCLPTSMGNLPSIPGWIGLGEYGAWSGTGGGFNGTGSSGTVPPKTQVFSSNARTTVVNSLVDRGISSLGYHHHQVITPGGADIVSNYYMTNSGVTIGSLGLTSSDTVMFGLEYSMSGAIAANLLKLNLTIQSNSSGAFGLASCGDSIALSSSAARDDSIVNSLLLTGPLKLNSSITHILTVLAIQSGAAGSDLLLDSGRLICFKAV